MCLGFVCNLEGDGQVDLIAHFPDVLCPQLSWKAYLRILWRRTNISYIPFQCFLGDEFKLWRTMLRLSVAVAL